MTRRTLVIAVALGALHCSSKPPAPAAPVDAGAQEMPAPIAPAPDAGAKTRDAGGPDTYAAPDTGGTPAKDAGTDTSLPGYKLTWSDEFNGPNGSAPDPTYWTHDVGGTGWGNDELEYYTDGAANTYEEDGDLVILATAAGASAYSCANDGDPGPCQYTSGRIRTQPGTGVKGFSQTYGRFEARMKLPGGAGLWPAFWMLGDDIGTVSWPACGEIDVMENLGQAPATVYGHLHMPQTGGNYGPGTGFTLSSGAFDDGYHVFAIEWQKGEVDFYVDDSRYDAILKSATPGDATWAFDGEPFFIVLNLAVGSKDSWPGAPTASTTFPAEVRVDYVRVYAKD